VLTNRARRVPSRFGTDPTNQPMVNSRYVAVADPVVALCDATLTNHLFTIVIESCCDSLIAVECCNNSSSNRDIPVIHKLFDCCICTKSTWNMTITTSWHQSN
jgi:hypothetical protein